MKINFRPSIAEHIEFLAALQKQRQPKAINTVSWIFFAFNLGFVPAILLLNNLFLYAGLAFAVNAVLTIGLLEWQQRMSLRKYYEEVWPELEQHDCEIEIDENGVGCEHAENRSFYPWSNVRSIGETEQMIFFAVGGLQILGAKRGFNNDTEAKTFLELARKYKSAAGEIR